MGLFDDIVKLADKGLQAVENGAVEKALVNGLDKLEAGLDTAAKSAEKAANAPEKLLKAAETKQTQVAEAAKRAQQGTARVIDIVQH